MKVSIIIPTYNRAELIKDTLRSIEVQTYTNWECIVVDDGSTDNTEEVINEFIARDSRFRFLINNRKKGAQGARNTGILNASGELTSFFDSDDYMYPSFLQKMTDQIFKKEVDVVTCFSNLLDVVTNEVIGQFRFINDGNIHDGLYNNRCYVDSNAAMIKTSKLFEIGLLDENSPALQEWDTHLRLSKICQYFTIKEVLVHYYKGGSDTISGNKVKAISGFTYILNKHSEYWKAYHYYNFIQFGKDAMRLFPIVNDKEFIKEQKKKLFDLDPRFRKEYVKIRLKRILQRATKF